MMESYDLALRLAQSIRRGERHADYERTVALSELYTKIITGEDMDSLMLQFTPRESKEMFDQRKRITQHITKTVSNNVTAIFKKIPRSNSVQRNISYSDHDTNKLKEINTILGEFWGDKSLDDYMNERWFELNFVDPNAFVVVEWKEFDNTTERLQPYPFEVKSSQAKMFEYINNDLQFLIARTVNEYWVFNPTTREDQQVNQEIYTIYGKNQTIVFKEIMDEKRAKEIIRDSKPNLKLDENYGLIPSYSNDQFVGGYFISSIRAQKVYEITVPVPHDLGYVPAQRIGVQRDLYTEGRTFVSPLDEAMPIFMKMIKANSEFDLTMSLHAFPQKLQYAPRCKERDCRDGILLSDGTQCTRCHGTGFETITTAQEAVTISLPKDKDEMIDLHNILVYLSPPIDLLKFQEDYVIDKLTALVKESIFNTELYTKKQVAETATGKNISLQSVYDSLYPVATTYSKQWRFFVTTIADATALDENLVAFYHFSKDFKMKSLTDLYLDLKMVGDAKASEFVKDEIEYDIARVIYSEDERALQKYNVKRSFFPFSGKSPEEIKVIISSPDLVTTFTKVFYANFGQVFDAIEMEQAAAGKDFYLMPRDLQWQLIQSKVEEMSAEIDSQKQKSVPVLINPLQKQ